MKGIAEYEKLFDKDVVDTSTNELGISLNNYSPKMFRKIAQITGDDEQPPGDLIMRGYQLRVSWAIVQAVLRGRRETILVKMPRQSGKTTLIDQTTSQLSTIPTLLMSHLYPHLKFGVRSGIYGPERGKATKLRDKIERVLSQSFYRDVLGVTLDRSNANLISLSCNSTILCGTANDKAKCPEQPSLHMAILEESQAISSMRIIKSIRPMLASVNGVLVMIGTASHDPKEHGLFYELCKKNDERRAQGLPTPGYFDISLQEVFSTPGTQKYRKFVLSEIREWGYHHPAIQSQYVGRWDFEIGLTYIRPEWLYALRKTEVKGMLACWREKEVCVGIDVAKVKDNTIVTSFEPPRIIEKEDGEVQIIRGKIRGWLDIQGDNYMDQGKMIKRWLSHYTIRSGLCDSRGPGRVLLDYLHTDMGDGLPTFPQIDGDEPSEEEIESEWTMLKQSILQGDWEYPKDEIPERYEFERQFKELIKVQKTDGRIRIDHPKKENGKKDYPDSFRLARKAAGDFEELIAMQSDFDNGFSRKKNQKPTEVLNNH